MNKQKIVETMIKEVMIIEQEENIDKFKNDNAMKKDAVAKIMKKLKETVENED